MMAGLRELFLTGSEGVRDNLERDVSAVHGC